MPPADAGSGLIFVENEGLTALATIMPPTPWALNSARRWLANCRFDDVAMFADYTNAWE